MRSDIDLTPDREFSDFNKNNGIYAKDYTHKSIPWRKKKKENRFYVSDGVTYISSTNIELNNNYNDILDDFQLHGIIMNNSTSTTTYTWNISTTDSMTTSSNKSKYVVYKTESTEESVKRREITNFPTGRRKDIIRNRQYSYVVDKNVDKFCSQCGLAYKDAPWRKHSKFNLCSDRCLAKYVTSTRYKKAKTVKKSNLFDAKRHVQFKNNRDRIEYIYNKSRRSYGKTYFHKELPWDYTDTYEGRFDNSWSLYRRKTSLIRTAVLSKALYYKGKETRMHTDKFQPDGRVPQEYDEIFDNLDWRELLLKRLDISDQEQKMQSIKQNKEMTQLNRSIFLNRRYFEFVTSINL